MLGVGQASAGARRSRTASHRCSWATQHPTQLERLATSDLPLIEADPEVIDRLRVLEAAGHIRVLLPPAHFDCDDCLRQHAANVFEILPAGWKALRTGAPGEKASPLTSPRPRPPKLAGIADWLSGTRHRSGE